MLPAAEPTVTVDAINPLHAAIRDSGQTFTGKQRPAIGRIVHYRLTRAQCDEVNERRDFSAATGHKGNHAYTVDAVPLMIVRVWPDEFGPGKDGVNGQAFLDGSDTLWVTSAAEGDEPGQWFWPPRV